jgi:type II restriction enzyme
MKFTPADELVRGVIEVFSPHFFPAAALIFASDTDGKGGFVDETAFVNAGVQVDSYADMPDVVLFDRQCNRFMLIDSVTNRGHVNEARRSKLSRLFDASAADLVFVTAFPDRIIMSEHADRIAWETEVWCASDPTHLIHFNGARFLGPYVERSR